MRSNTSAGTARRGPRVAGLAAVVTLGLPLFVVGAPRAGAAVDTTLDVRAVNRTEDGVVSFVAAVQPPPAHAPARSAARLTVAGRAVPTVLAPVLARETAVALVVDTSVQGPLAATSPGGADDARSGAVAFLQQLPVDAHYAVVADRSPPAVASPLSAGSAAARGAVATLRPGGEPSTSEAITLALRQLPGWPLVQPVVVLYTSAADAGGESASVLGARLAGAHAVLAVVHTDADPAYWDRVATATGGFTVSVGPPGALGAFAGAADALSSRYVITSSLAAGASPGGTTPSVSVPPAGSADLAITIDGRTVTTSVALPAAPAGPGASAGSASAGASATAGAASPAATVTASRSSGPGRWWWGALVAVVALAVAAASAGARRRRRTEVTTLPERLHVNSTFEAEPAEIVATLLPQHHPDDPVTR